MAVEIFGLVPQEFDLYMSVLRAPSHPTGPVLLLTAAAVCFRIFRSFSSEQLLLQNFQSLGHG